jgi:hypothetical protein
MIEEYPVWRRLLTNYSRSDRKALWPETSAALRSILQIEGDGQWDDEAALCLACGKASFEDDIDGAIAGLEDAARRYSGRQTVVEGFNMHVGYLFSQTWMKWAPGIARMDESGEVTWSRPFDKHGSLDSPVHREALAYFNHMDSHPRDASVVAKVFTAQLLISRGDVAGAEKVLEGLIGNGEEIGRLGAADREAASKPDGFLIKGLWRPEYAACHYLIYCRERLYGKDAGTETALRLVRLCSADGWLWRGMNRAIGDRCSAEGCWKEAREQYELALSGCRAEVSYREDRMRAILPASAAQADRSLDPERADIQAIQARLDDVCSKAGGQPPVP